MSKLNQAAFSTMKLQAMALQNQEQFEDEKDGSVVLHRSVSAITQFNIDDHCVEKVYYEVAGRPSKQKEGGSILHKDMEETQGKLFPAEVLRDGSGLRASMISETTHLWPILSVRTVVEAGEDSQALENDRDDKSRGRNINSITSSSGSRGRGRNSQSHSQSRGNTPSSSLSPMRNNNSHNRNGLNSSLNSSNSPKRGMASTSPIPTRGRRASVDIHSALGKVDVENVMGYRDPYEMIAHKHDTWGIDKWGSAKEGIYSHQQKPRKGALLRGGSPERDAELHNVCYRLSVTQPFADGGSLWDLMKPSRPAAQAKFECSHLLPQLVVPVLLAVCTALDTIHKTGVNDPTHSAMIGIALRSEKSYHGNIKPQNILLSSDHLTTHVRTPKPFKESPKADAEGGSLASSLFASTNTHEAVITAKVEEDDEYWRVDSDESEDEIGTKELLHSLRAPADVIAHAERKARFERLDSFIHRAQDIASLCEVYLSDFSLRSESAYSEGIEHVKQQQGHNTVLLRKGFLGEDSNESHLPSFYLSRDAVGSSNGASAGVGANININNNNNNNNSTDINDSGNGNSNDSSSSSFSSSEGKRTQADDIWALGCVLYTLATGAFLLQGHGKMTKKSGWTVRSELSTASMRERTGWNMVPLAVRDLIENMLDLDAAKRPTAKELLSKEFMKSYRSTERRMNYVDTALLPDPRTSSDPFSENSTNGKGKSYGNGNAGGGMSGQNQSKGNNSLNANANANGVEEEDEEDDYVPFTGRPTRRKTHVVAQRPLADISLAPVADVDIVTVPSQSQSRSPPPPPAPAHASEEGVKSPTNQPSLTPPPPGGSRPVGVTPPPPSGRSSSSSSGSNSNYNGITPPPPAPGGRPNTGSAAPPPPSGRSGTTTPPPPKKETSINIDNIRDREDMKKWKKMLDMHIPEGAVRGKMTVDGLSEADITAFFGTSTSTSSSSISPPPPAPAPKKGNSQDSNKGTEPQESQESLEPQEPQEADVTSNSDSNKPSRRVSITMYATAAADTDNGSSDSDNSSSSEISNLSHISDTAAATNDNTYTSAGAGASSSVLASLSTIAIVRASFSVTPLSSSSTTTNTNAGTGADTGTGTDALGSNARGKVEMDSGPKSGPSAYGKSTKSDLSMTWAAPPTLRDLQFALLRRSKQLHKTKLRRKKIQSALPLASPEQCENLWVLAKKGDVRSLHALLMRFRGDGDFVNAEDKIHQTALTYASSRGHTTCVRVLLAHGADPGHCTKNGDTALVFAINHCQSQSNLDVVSLLLSHGWEPRPLPVEEIEVSETLLEDFKFDRTLWADTVNAPANVRRRWGALHYAAYNAHPKVLKLLLEAGADPSCRDIAGELPIHVLNKKYVSAAGADFLHHQVRCNHVRSLLQKAQAQWSGLGKKRPDTNPTKDTDLPSRDDFDYNPMGIVGVGGVKDVGEVGNVGSPGVGDNHENGEAFCGHRRQWLLHRVNTVKAALKLERALLKSAQQRLRREQPVDVPTYAGLIRAYARGGDTDKLKQTLEYCRGRIGGLDAVNGCDRGYSMQATHCAAATGAVDCLRILLHLNRASEYSDPDLLPDRAFLPLSANASTSTTGTSNNTGNTNNYTGNNNSNSNSNNSRSSSTTKAGSGSWDVHPTFLRSLVKRGLVLDVTKCDAQGGTVLHHAALGGHDSTMVYLLDYLGSHSSTGVIDRLSVSTEYHSHSHGRSHSHSGEREHTNNTNCAPDSLLTTILNQPFRPSYANLTALHIAAMNNFLQMLLLLLACGADTSVRDREGKTAIDYCYTEQALKIFNKKDFSDVYRSYNFTWLNLPELSTPTASAYSPRPTSGNGMSASSTTSPSKRASFSGSLVDLLGHQDSGTIFNNKNDGSATSSHSDGGPISGPLSPVPLRSRRASNIGIPDHLIHESNDRQADRGRSADIAALERFAGAAAMHENRDNHGNSIRCTDGSHATAHLDQAHGNRDNSALHHSTVHSHYYPHPHTHANANANSNSSKSSNTHSHTQRGVQGRGVQEEKIDQDQDQDQDNDHTNKSNKSKMGRMSKSTDVPPIPLVMNISDVPGATGSSASATRKVTCLLREAAHLGNADGLRPLLKLIRGSICAGRVAATTGEYIRVGQAKEVPGKMTVNAVDVNTPDEHGRSAAILATARGHCDTLTMLLRACKEQEMTILEIDGEDEEGPCELVLGVVNFTYNNSEIKWKNENSREQSGCTHGGTSALHVAASMGRGKCLRLLLDFGAGIDAQDRNGETPLHLASRAGKKECISALLEYGCRTDIRSAAGKSAANSTTLHSSKKLIENAIGKRGW